MIEWLASLSMGAGGEGDNMYGIPTRRKARLTARPHACKMPCGGGLIGSAHNTTPFHDDMGKKTRGVQTND